MQGRACLAGMGLVSLLAGCSTHPLPENVSKRDTTYRIVAKVRCEARDAVVSYTGLFPEKVYDQFLIGYSFSLDITENNDASLDLKFFNPFSNGERTLGIGGGIDRQRQNARAFKIADTFGDLRKNLSDGYCAEAAKGKNAIYPMLGKIGLSETLETFLRLNQLGGGTSHVVDPLVDTIDFVTIVKGNIAPVIELSPVTSGVGLATASATGAVKRTDKHSLTFTVSWPPAAEARGKAAQGKGAGQTITPAARAKVFQQLDIQEGRRLTTTLKELQQEIESRQFE